MNKLLKYPKAALMGIASVNLYRLWKLFPVSYSRQTNDTISFHFSFSRVEKAKLIIRLLSGK